jgi:hypothetical protein
MGRRRQLRTTLGRRWHPAAILAGAGALAAAAAGCNGASVKAVVPPTTYHFSTTTTVYLPPPNPTASTLADATVVTVRVTTYHISLSQSSFSPGPYTFVVTNATTPGAYQAPQAIVALAIVGPGVRAQTEDLEPGQSGQLPVELSDGTYHLYSPIPGQAAEGISTYITVTGSGEVPGVTASPSTS